MLSTRYTTIKAREAHLDLLKAQHVFKVSCIPVHMFTLTHSICGLLCSRHVDDSFLRADGCEYHVQRFEEEEAQVADPDVVSHIHEEYGPCDQERESPQDQFPPHGPLQRHVSHGDSRCSS